MEFSFNIEEKREEMRYAKEMIWEGLNGFGDVMCEISEEASKPIEFNEKYNPSLKMMHHCVTKFADEMNGLLDGIRKSQNAEVALKVLAAEKASRAQAGETLGDEAMEVFDGDGDDSDLSDSDYNADTRNTHTYIKHKGFNYRKHSTNTDTPFGFPDGKYKCTGEKCKCTGTMEPILKRNGKVHIRGIDPHSCK